MGAPGSKERPIIFSSWQPLYNLLGPTIYSVYLKPPGLKHPLFPFLAMASITNMLFIGCVLLISNKTPPNPDNSQMMDFGTSPHPVTTDRHLIINNTTQLSLTIVISTSASELRLY